MCQAHGRDIGAPHRVRVRDVDPAEQIGINRVLGVGCARRRSRRHARKPQDPHQSLHALAVHHLALRLQKDHHAPAAVERVTGRFRVNQRQEHLVQRADDRLG